MHERGRLLSVPALDGWDFLPHTCCSWAILNDVRETSPRKRAFPGRRNCPVVSQRPQSSPLVTLTAGWAPNGGSQREGLASVRCLLQQDSPSLLFVKLCTPNHGKAPGVRAIFHSVLVITRSGRVTKVKQKKDNLHVAELRFEPTFLSMCYPDWASSWDDPLRASFLPLSSCR